MPNKQPENGDADRQSELTGGSNPVEPRTVNSVDLFEGVREICIRHGDELYRLRITRNEKLILTK